MICRSRTRREACVLASAHACMLACMLAGLIAGVRPAHAQDPAAVGNRYDPAFVGGRRAPPRQAPSDPIPLPTEDTRQSDSVEKIEALYKRVQTQLDDTTGDGAPIGADEVQRYRNDVEGLVREHWNTLSAQTRDLYASQYGRTQPDNVDTSMPPSNTDRSPDRADLLRGLERGPEDTRDSMRGLESLLTPMLQELKQGLDATLQQSANRR